MISVIVNPNAGRGKAAANAAVFERYATERGVAYMLERTGAKGDAERLARRAAENGCERLIVIGGDGTLNEAVNGLMPLERGVEVGLIPSGSGNDFAKLLGIPADPAEAARTALDAHTRVIDVGVMNGRAFLNVAGMGMDVNTLLWHGKLRFLGRGMLPYAVALLLALTVSPPLEAVVETEGHTERGRLIMASIANGQYFGGGMRVAPRARLDDGLLDLCIVRRTPLIRMLVRLPGFFKGNHLGFDFVSYIQCESVFIPGDRMAQLDGELAPVSDARFTVRRGALRICVPHEGNDMGA